MEIKRLRPDKAVFDSSEQHGLLLDTFLLVILRKKIDSGSESEISSLTQI